MLRDLWRLLAPFHRTFYLFVGILVVYEGLQILDGYTLSFVIKLFETRPEPYVWVILLVVLLVYDEIFARLDNTVDWHVITKHSYPIYQHLKTMAVSKFLSMDIPWHARHNSGALVGKVSNGVWKVMELVDAMSWEFVPTMVQTVLSLIPILFISPQTALISMAAFCIFSWITLNGHRERKKYRTLRHDLYEDEWHKSVETVQSVETSQMFGQTGRMLSDQRDLHGRIVQTGQDETYVGVYRYNRWQIRTLTIARRSVLAIWIWQLHMGTLDIASLIFLNVLTEKLFHSFWRFARLVDRASEASESIGRLTSLMDEQPTGKEGSIVPEVTGPVGISMQNVRFAYEGDYDEASGALHDFNLEIEPGSIVALVGPSGAGKTTIQKIITRRWPIQSGNILVAGTDINDWSHEELLKMFSYVPQGDDVYIYAGTLAYNIAFPNPFTSRENIERAATLAGIHDFIAGLPDGFDTVVGERGKRLSGGQKQRVALARAILADKPILILDEATSAVDAITEHEIQTKMKTILSGKTAIIIAHRLSTIWDLANKIVVLDNGRKVEEGTHQELLTLGGLYSKMVEHQTAS